MKGCPVMTGIAKLVLVGITLLCLTGCYQDRRYKAIEVYNRGYGEFCAGDYTKAAGYYKWSHSLKPEYSAPLIGLAQCHVEFAKKNFSINNTAAALHDLEQARYWSELAIDADPGNPQTTQARVEVMKLRGEIDAMIKTSKWGTKVQGPSAASLLLEAKTYMEAGAYDEAEVAIKQALAVDPHDVNAHIQAGQFYEKIGKHEQSLQQYEEAYRLDPTHTEALGNITQLGGIAPETQSPPAPKHDAEAEPEIQ